MSRIARINLLVLAAAVCLAARTVAGCTSGCFTGPFGDANVVSWRNFDVPALQHNATAWVPQSHTIHQLPVFGYRYASRLYTARFSFVCMTAAPAVSRALLASLKPVLRLDAGHWPGNCVDGMNTKGLSVAAQLQPASAGRARRYDISGNALEQMDFATYLLAMYSDVPSIVADLESGKLNVVVNPTLERFIQALFSTNATTLHFNIHDSQQRSLVVEFSGPSSLRWFANDELRVLANEPLFEEQLASFNAWKAANSNPETTSEGSALFNLPGSFSSPHRFIRAAALREPALAWKWPQDSQLSPFWVAARVPATNPTLVTALLMQQTTALPKGLDSSGGMQVAGGNTLRALTWWSSLRDHKSSTYFYRTANDPSWKRIDLNAAQWFTMTARGGIQYSYPTAGVWWSDIASP